MATIRDISIKCGVSVSTVSKVLNGYKEIGEETKKQVLKAAEELGYIGSAYTKQVRLKKSYNIGVLFDTLSYGLKNEYFAHILASFREEASKRGYDITFIQNTIGNRKITYLEHCQYRNFDGVCIVCADYSNPEVLEVVNSEFAVVTIDHSFNEAISILSDNVDGMKQMIQYIIKSGHMRIAYIHGTKASVTHNRLVSFYHAMEEHSIEVPEEYLRESEYRNPEMAEQITYELLKLVNPPTCIVAPDDFAALGVIKAINHLGLQVPEDISVAGYDGIVVSQAIDPKLTTIKQDTDKIGEEACRRLIELIEKPMNTPLEHIIMPVYLMGGESVRDINKGKHTKKQIMS